MAEEKKQTKEAKQDKQDKPEAKKKEHKEERTESLIRIYGFDIPGSRNIYAGLTRIKGISWALSNVICLKLNLPRTKKVSDITQKEIEQIEAFIKNIQVPDYMKNRRSDPETGQTSHLLSTDLDMKREFDIKRLKQIKSYKGIRHAYKLPVRGQRTKSHFRAKGKSLGVKKAKK